MRLSRIVIKDFSPIEFFEAEELSDLVVIAGANGAGKTRLVKQLINSFQDPNNPQVEFVLEATNVEERLQFTGTSIVSSDISKRQIIQNFLQKNKSRRNFKSGVLYFESNRTITNVKPLQFEFNYIDPYTENIGWTAAMSPLTGRWQDSQHSIFKKIHMLRTQLGSRALQLGREGKTEMGLRFTDPMIPFKEAFSKLLHPKVLVDPDLQQQTLMYSQDGNERPIDTLSSGEREVVNIAFDFILRKPEDCIVFFDEPELHLHPELLNRLIKTLREAGDRNQFFLISHSPEVIASSLDDTVIFLTPPKKDGSNQATILKPGGETTEALNQLGQSVGVVALGKKIVLIEGQDGSLDKKTYSAILSDLSSDFVLIPSGSKESIVIFQKVKESVLDKALWGIKFFMVVDRDTGFEEN